MMQVFIKYISLLQQTQNQLKMIPANESQHQNLVFQMSSERQRSELETDKQQKEVNKLIKIQSKQAIQQGNQISVNPQNTIDTNIQESNQQLYLRKKNSSKLLLKQRDRYQVKNLQRGMFTNNQQSVDQLKIIYNDGSPTIKKQQSTESMRRKRPIKLSPLQNSSGVKLITQQQLNKRSKSYKTIENISQQNFSITPIKAREIKDLKQFSQQPIPKNRKLVGILKRNREGTKRFFPQFDLFLNEQVKFILNSKRKSCFCTSTYHIGADKQQPSQQGSRNYVATIKSNFSGSEFNVYKNSDGQIQLLATVVYVSQITCKEVPRALQVYLLSPYFKYNDLDGSSFRMEKSLRQLYEVGTNKQNSKILKLINKKPTWDQRRQSWCLDFHGKALYSSVKNMILVSQSDQTKQAMILAKAGDNIFNIEIAHPLSPRVGLAIASSCFDWKWVSQ